MALHEGFRETLCYEVLQNALNVVFKDHLISATEVRQHARNVLSMRNYHPLPEGYFYD
jgi:hypothetical protein